MIVAAGREPRVLCREYPTLASFVFRSFFALVSIRYICIPLFAYFFSLLFYLYSNSPSDTTTRHQVVLHTYIHTYVRDILHRIDLTTELIIASILRNLYEWKPCLSIIKQATSDWTSLYRSNSIKYLKWYIFRAIMLWRQYSVRRIRRLVSTVVTHSSTYTSNSDVTVNQETSLPSYMTWFHSKLMPIYCFNHVSDYLEV